MRAIKPTHMEAHAVDLSKIRLYNILWRRRTERASAIGLIQFAWYVWRHTKALLPGFLRSRMVRLAGGTLPPQGRKIRKRTERRLAASSGVFMHMPRGFDHACPMIAPSLPESELDHSSPAACVAVGAVPGRRKSIRKGFGSTTFGTTASSCTPVVRG